MKTKIKKMFAGVGIASILTTLIPVQGVAASNKLVYPLQTISKLACRFTEFGELTSNCKQQLPILHSKDYKKYAKESGGYNDYTRLYTVLWGASYKYGWDVGYGGHMGVDIATAQGTPVYSMANGKVIKAGWSNGGFGNYISIKHTINGKAIVSNYAHLHTVEVSVGDTVSAGEKIGEVGSTGNSTGNHLHFQIDTKTNFSPMYYSRKTCPYSYYKITEEGVCFDELAKITVDPLKFLETNGGILDETVVSINTKKKTTVEMNSKNVKTVKKEVRADKVVKSDIFDRTVYKGYPHGDIRKVQQIYKSLGYYDGEITSNYRDVEKSVLKYQLEKGIISSKSDDGAGWFGPKTRSTTKKDWDAFVKNGGKITTTYITTSTKKQSKDMTVEEQIEQLNLSNDTRVSAGNIEKIERTNMMTREERETKEVNDFISKYNINLEFVNPGANIPKGGEETVKLTVQDKRGRAFKGNMPGTMTFIANSNMVDVFPQKLFYFTDGKRDIKITGITEGSTTLYVKIGNVTVKQFKLNVYNNKKSITPKSALILTPRKVVLGDATKSIAVFKDTKGKKLINLRYGGSYTLKASKGNSVCIKKGSLKTIKQTHLRSCDDSEFTEEVTFDYNDTIAGLLLFDIKGMTDGASYSIVENNGKTYANKNVSVVEPKGITPGYTYEKEVIDSLKNGITTAGLERGYFLQDRNLSEKDALTWIKNSLKKMSNKSTQYKTEIRENIQKVEALEKNASSQEITRGELLDLTSTYLVFSTMVKEDLDFKDLDTISNRLANTIFNKNETWKDQFGSTHFRPTEKVTRGEGAYFLLTAMKRNQQEQLVTLK